MLHRDVRNDEEGCNRKRDEVLRLLELVDELNNKPPASRYSPPTKTQSAAPGVRKYLATGRDSARERERDAVWLC